MKKYSIIICIYLTIFSLKGQNSDIPFAIIESPPIYQGCEGNKYQLNNCMNSKILKHIGRNFDIDFDQLGLSAGKKRIFVIFVINANGDVVDIEARGPHPKLEVEAKRIIRLLPKFTPGKQRNIPVRVRYSVPIVFNIEGDDAFEKLTYNSKKTNSYYNPKKEYETSYQNILNKKYEGKWFQKSEVDKIIKYLGKNQYDKAESFCEKRNNSHRVKSRRAILSEKYFLKAKELISKSKYEDAVSILNRTLTIYSKYLKYGQGLKIHYPVEKNIKQLIERELGICYINLSNTAYGTVKNNFIKKAYEKFQISNSTDLITKYDQLNYYYIEENKYSNNPSILNVLHSKCIKSNELIKFKANCKIIGENLIEQFWVNENETYLNKALSIFKKYETVKWLNYKYEEIANSFINSDKPKRALDYIKKTQNSKKIDEYKLLIDTRLRSIAIEKSKELFEELKAIDKQYDKTRSNLGKSSGKRSEKWARFDRAFKKYNDKTSEVISSIDNLYSSLNLKNNKNLQTAYEFYDDACWSQRYFYKSYTWYKNGHFNTQRRKFDEMLNGDKGVLKRLITVGEFETPEISIKKIDEYNNAYPDNHHQKKLEELKKLYIKMIALDNEVMEIGGKNVFEEYVLIRDCIHIFSDFKNYPNREYLIDRLEVLSVEKKRLLALPENSSSYAKLDDDVKKEVTRIKRNWEAERESAENRRRRRAKAFTWLKDVFIPKVNYSSSSTTRSDEKPCYTITKQKEDKFLGKVSYYIRCKSGKTVTITWRESKVKYGTPYNYGMDLLDGKKTLREAAQSACNCWD